MRYPASVKQLSKMYPTMKRRSVNKYPKSVKTVSRPCSTLLAGAKQPKMHLLNQNKNM